MARWSYSFACTFHYTSVITMQTYLKVLKFENDTFCHKCVFKMKSILSFFCLEMYRAVCIQLTHFSREQFEYMCTIS